MKKIVKYFVFGISCVIPGLCSATTAIILRIYNELLDSIISIFNVHKWKKNACLYFSIFMGIVVGIICLKKIYYLCPFLLNLIFLGIVLRSFPFSFNNDIKVKCNLFFWIGLIIVLLLSFVNKQLFVIDYQNINFKFFLLVCVNGIIVSLAMILPGISGALMLVSFGLYFPLLNGISNIFDYNNFMLVLTFVISFIVGLVLFSLILKNIMKTKTNVFNSLINGMIIGTIISIILELPLYNYHIIEVILGLIIFIMIYLIPNYKKSN